MKNLLCVLALTCAQAGAIEVVDGKPVLNPREVALLQLCEQQGGCAVVSRQMVTDFLKANLARVIEQAEEEIKAAETACRKRI